MMVPTSTLNLQLWNSDFMKAASSRFTQSCGSSILDAHGPAQLPSFHSQAMSPVQVQQTQNTEDVIFPVPDSSYQDFMPGLETQEDTVYQALLQSGKVISEEVAGGLGGSVG